MNSLQANNLLITAVVGSLLGAVALPAIVFLYNIFFLRQEDESAPEAGFVDDRSDTDDDGEMRSFDDPYATPTVKLPNLADIEVPSLSLLTGFYVCIATYFIAQIALIAAGLAVLSFGIPPTVHDRILWLLQPVASCLILAVFLKYHLPTSPDRALKISAVFIFIAAVTYLLVRLVLVQQKVL